jgi:hypothetical protein
MCVGTALAVQIGLLDTALAFVYWGVTVFGLRQIHRAQSQIGIALFTLQLAFVPISLLFCGVIMFFQGWRLFPIGQFGYFMLQIPLVFFVLKDGLFTRAKLWQPKS